MAEKRDTSTDPPTFSQRYDYEPLPPLNQCGWKNYLTI